MMNKPLFTFFFLAFSSVCFGQQKDQIKNLIDDHLKIKGKNPVQSIQIFISQNDLIYNEAVGFADGKNVKADKGNQFKIASITKMMTAVVILQMQEEGKLVIDDSISKYLKDISYIRVKELHYYNGKSYAGKITIRQLLQHKSGIADIFTDATFRFYLNEYLNKKQEWNAAKLMHRYYKYGLNRKTHFSPNNGYFIRM